MDVAEGAPLGPFEHPPFSPWCQINALLSRPKKFSADRCIIMDLSWPYPPLHSVNASTPMDLYLGQPLKLRLPSPQDLCELIRQAGPGCFLFSADVARAYRQLPLDPSDWCLTCLHTDSRIYVDVSLPFGPRWAAACCQRVTSLVTHELASQHVTTLCYIDDFAGVSTNVQQAKADFSKLQQLINDLGLQEAKHKAFPPSQALIWLGLLFNTKDMTTIPEPKLADIQHLVRQWADKHSAHIRFTFLARQSTACRPVLPTCTSVPKQDASYPASLSPPWKHRHQPRVQEGP